MRPAAIAIMLLLSACKAEPSFDERYAKTAHDLRQKGIALDAELASQAALAPSEAPAPASSRAAR